jgi:hypothetical protein
MKEDAAKNKKIFLSCCVVLWMPLEDIDKNRIWKLFWMMRFNDLLFLLYVIGFLGCLETTVISKIFSLLLEG